MGGAVGAIFGFLGSIVTSVTGLFVAASGLVFFIVYWKAGAIPPTIELLGIMIGGFFRVVVAGFEFLGTLVTSVL